MPNFAGFVSYLGATCLFAIFEISHQSRSPLRFFFEIPKLLKNTGQNWATYFFTITKTQKKNMINYTVKSLRNPIDSTTKFYPQIGKQKYASLETIAEEISNMCTVTMPDIVSVLSAVQEQVEEILKTGHTVRLGYLGSFRPTIVGNAVAKKEDVTTKDILRVRVRFTMGSYLRKHLVKEQMKFKREG